MIMTKVCDEIHNTLSSKEGVLVHCGLGISRSGSVVLGYRKLQESLF